MALVPLFALPNPKIPQRNRLLRRQAAPKSLFWAPGGLDELPKVHFEFHFISIGKSTMAFFYRLVTVMARNKNFDAVSQTDLTRVQFRLYRRLSYPVRAIFSYISLQDLPNDEHEKQNVCRARRVTLPWRSWINFSPCKHSGPPSRVKAQTRHLIMHKLRWLGEGKGNLRGVRRGGNLGPQP